MKKNETQNKIICRGSIDVGADDPVCPKGIPNCAQQKQMQNKETYGVGAGLVSARGITLIALVITIIILLILAGVAINLVIGENGILNNAQMAKEKYKQAQTKEEIDLALAEWEISINTSQDKTFAEFMKEKFGAKNVIESSENEVIITVANGDQYKVQGNGTITSAKDFNISKSSLTLELTEGETVTEELTASVTGITGEITWSIPENNGVATISNTTGNSTTVTAVAKGTTTITVSCGGYTKTCTVEVKKTVAIGSYVKYDVAYTDTVSNWGFNSNWAWRYLGIDEAGRILLVSTTIPVNLRYASGEQQDWWVDQGDDASTKAAKGLRDKFEEITFTNKKGTQLGSSFRTTDTNVSGKIVSIRSLTLEDVNRAVNAINKNSARTETSTDAGFKDLTGKALGLFDLQKSMAGYSSFTYIYWLATPAGVDHKLCMVGSASSGVVGIDGGESGVRPVIVLSEDVVLEDVDGDGVLEINY